jgi:hypothetical protein
MSNPALPSVIRGCDGCTMCCKVMRVPELPKEAGVWCAHCARGTGCGIYETRPDSCRGFQCMYTTNATLSEAWKPSECKFVIAFEPGGGGRLSIYVDTQRPDAWRREPFLSTFHRWAEQGLERQAQVCVFVGRQVFVIVPDRVVDLGQVAPDELILTKVTRTPRGLMLEPFKATKDDPRAQAVLASPTGRR